MKVVIIDNYDSFTYNLAHLVKELGVKLRFIAMTSSSCGNWSHSIRLY